MRGNSLFLLPMIINFKRLQSTWQRSFRIKSFKLFLGMGIILFIIILFSFPYFFNSIEARNGKQLNDFVLNAIPAINLSIPIFVIIWGTSIILIVEAIKNPTIFIGFLWSFIFLSLSRMLTISAIPLNAPHNLVPLIDPISNTFYGGKFLTKDLFYSGHTATQFLIYFHLEKKWQKNISLFATFSIGIMVLFQHVHYSIDVVFAFIFAPIIFFISNKLILKNIKQNT